MEQALQAAHEGSSDRTHQHAKPPGEEGSQPQLIVHRSSPLVPQKKEQLVVLLSTACHDGSEASEGHMYTHTFLNNLVQRERICSAPPHLHTLF